MLFCNDLDHKTWVSWVKVWNLDDCTLKDICKIHFPRTWATEYKNPWMLLLSPASPPSRLLASQRDRSHNRLFFLAKIFQSMTIGLIILSIDFVVCLFSIWSSEVSPFQRSLFPGGLMGDHQDERLLGLRHEATVLGGVLRETRHVGKSWFLLVLGWTSFWQYYKVIDWSVGKFRWRRKKVFLRPFNIHNQLA